MDKTSQGLQCFLQLLPSLSSLKLGNKPRHMKENFEWFGDAVLEGILPILIVTHLNTNQDNHPCGKLELSNTLLEAAREKILSNSSLATVFEHLGMFCADMLKELLVVVEIRNFLFHTCRCHIGLRDHLRGSKQSKGKRIPGDKRSKETGTGSTVRGAN
jgi:hypothetical protein